MSTIGKGKVHHHNKPPLAQPVRRRPTMALPAAQAEVLPKHAAVSGKKRPEMTLAFSRRDDEQLFTDPAPPAPCSRWPDSTPPLPAAPPAPPSSPRVPGPLPLLPPPFPFPAPPADLVAPVPRYFASPGMSVDPSKP